MLKIKLITKGNKQTKQKTKQNKTKQNKTKQNQIKAYLWPTGG